MVKQFTKPGNYANLSYPIFLKVDILVHWCKIDENVCTNLLEIFCFEMIVEISVCEIIVDHSCPPRGWLMQGWELEFLNNT